MFPRPRHMPWQVLGPRAGHRWVQLPFGAFQSSACGIDPAPSIPVMHGAGSGAEPSTNVPSGKRMGCGSWQGLAGAPRAASAAVARRGSRRACRVTPQGRGGFLQLLAREMLRVSAKMSRAAVPVMELLFPCPSFWLPMKPPHIMMCGDPGGPSRPSCTPRPHAPEDRLELPWLSAQTQHHGITPGSAPCHGEPEQLLSGDGATGNAAVSSTAQEWLLTWSPP